MNLAKFVSHQSKKYLGGRGLSNINGVSERINFEERRD